MVVHGRVPAIEHLLVVHAEASVHQGAAVRCPPGHRRPCGGRAARHDDRHHPDPPKRTEDSLGGLRIASCGEWINKRAARRCPPPLCRRHRGGRTGGRRPRRRPPPHGVGRKTQAARRAAPVITEEVVMGRRERGGQARGSKTTRGRRSLGWRRTMPLKEVAVVLVIVIATAQLLMSLLLLALSLVICCCVL